MKRLHVLLIGLMLTLLTACASNNPPRNLPDPAVGLDPALGRDPAEAQLAEAATSVSQSLTSLNAIQQAATPPKYNPDPPDPASYGMANLVSLDWSGPIEPLVGQIAKATGYRVNIVGKPPAIPILVTISEKDTPIGIILRNAAYQCRTQADIVVYPKTRTIELRYAET